LGKYRPVQPVQPAQLSMCAMLLKESAASPAVLKVHLVALAFLLTAGTVLCLRATAGQCLST